MDKNLTYQQARRIRNTKVSDLLADQLLYEPTIRGAIGRTVSLKFQSKVKGIKEKFDPLNIAKFLTGGSKLGPALLGKLTGRNIKDIEYFTGRNKPIRVNRDTASKIRGTGQGGSNAEMNATLVKIFDFLKKTQELEIKNKEKNQNFEEDRQLKAEKRHKELLTALGRLNGKEATAPTAKPIKGSGLFDDMLDMLARLGSMAKSALEGLAKLTETVGKMAVSLAKVAARIGMSLAEAGIDLLGTTAGTATALGAVGVAALVAHKAETDKIRENPNAPEYKDNPLAMELRGESVSEAAAAKKNVQKSKKQMTRTYIQDLVNSDLKDSELKEETGSDRKTLQKWLNDNPRTTMFEPPKPEVKPVTSGLTAQQANETRSNFAKIDPRLVSNQSTKLNNVMHENLEASLPKKPSNQTQSTINNILQSKQSPVQKGVKLAEIAVRNLEPVFLDMIMRSTQLV